MSKIICKYCGTPMYKEDKDTWGGVTTTWHTCLLCKSVLTVSKHEDKIIAEEWKEHK